MTSETVISAHGLGKQYRIWTQSRPQSLSDRLSMAVHRRRQASRRSPLRREVWALRNVTFDVHRGEVIGVIGPNGAGKSTLLSVLARITDPTEGYAELRGRVSSLLEVGTGFHPELTGRDNVYLNGAILGMSRSETEAKFDEIVEFSGVREFIDVPVKRYSSGMYVRLAFAVAAHLDPEILLLDEVLAVGDRAFQAKCLARISEMVDKGRAVVFVSHDVASVSHLCSRGLVLNGGQQVFLGDIDEAVATYLASSHVGADPETVTREGSGELRVTKITVTNADGGSAIVAGDPISVRVDVAAPGSVPGGHLRLELGIHSTLGGKYVHLSTDFDPSRPFDRISLSRGASIVCQVESLPLKPGTYVFSATIERAGGELVDRLEDQAMFGVVPSDFFGTGVPPGESHPAPVLVRHHWDVFGDVRSPVVADLAEQTG
jgi:lipopolysaccharide transport system ATP-binding protein